MKYETIYTSIIERGKNRLPFPGCHKHRIIPGYKKGKYIDNNITYLTRQEHRIIHAIRFILWGNKADAIACVALGGKNPGGYHLDKITCDKIRQKAIGRIAWNKGLSNEKARQRMLTNNPMKNPLISAKVANKNKGKTSPLKGKIAKSNPLYINEYFTFSCIECGTVVKKRTTAENIKYQLFCSRSCQAKQRNKKEWIVIFPNKIKSITYNLKAFCIENGLDYNHIMYRRFQYKEKTINHKGFIISS